MDAQDAEHLLFDTDFTATGENLAAVDTHSGNKAAIFNLLKDDSAHTFYFFLWINQAGNAVISAVQLWEGVGTCSTERQEVLQLNFSGISSVYVRHTREGTGSMHCAIAYASGLIDMYLANNDTSGHLRIPVAVINQGDRVILINSVPTDLKYIYQILCNLRSEQ